MRLGQGTEALPKPRPGRHGWRSRARYAPFSVGSGEGRDRPRRRPRLCGRRVLVLRDRHGLRALGRRQSWRRRRTRPSSREHHAAPGPLLGCGIWSALFGQHGKAMDEVVVRPVCARGGRRRRCNGAGRARRGVRRARWLHGGDGGGLVLHLVQVGLGGSRTGTHEAEHPDLVLEHLEGGPVRVPNWVPCGVRIAAAATGRRGGRM